MMRRTLCVVAAIAALTATMSCGSTGGGGGGGGDRPGFLTDYSRLGPGDPGMVWLGDDPGLGEFDEFMIIKPVVFLHHADAPGRGTGLRELVGFTRARLSSNLEGGYRVENVANDGVAMIRVALTDLDAEADALDDVDGSVVSGAGLGRLAVEGEVLDPATREPIAVLVMAMPDVQLTSGGVSHRGNAETAIDNFAKRLRRHIDEAHGR